MEKQRHLKTMSGWRNAKTQMKSEGGFGNKETASVTYVAAKNVPLAGSNPAPLATDYFANQYQPRGWPFHVAVSSGLPTSPRLVLGLGNFQLTD